MSAVFSKSAQKRSRTSSNETKTSFVESVTSRVSSLLPSKIVKWFSRPNSSSTNGSTATAEAEDSSTDDEGPESPIVIPAKRMRYNTPTKFNNYNPSDANCSTSNIEITEIAAAPFAGAHYPTSRNNVTLTPIKVSESHDITKEKSEVDTPRNSQYTVSNIGQSVASKRKSIFDKTGNAKIMKSNKKPSQNEEKKPYFKPHLLGSTFYPGRTMYGGAASSHMSQANIQQHTVAQVNEAKGNEDSAMSTSTRRIMDLLESYSSPLMEARRIPQYIKPKNQSSPLSTPESANANKTMSYKTQELYVPRQASLLRLKQKSRLMDSTISARQIIASQSSTSNDTLYNKSPNNSTNNNAKTSQINQPRQTLKMEQSYKITNNPKSWMQMTKKRIEDNVELATPVKLPSVVLKIDQNKLPKFTLDTPAVNNLPATSTPKAASSAPKQFEVKTNTEIPSSKPETESNCSIFTFSNPVNISCDTPDADITPPLFTFDSPERRIEQNCDNQSHVSSVVGVDKDQPKISSETKVKDWQCPDCWVNNKADVPACICCGFKKQKSPKCTVCKLADSQVHKDKCTICEKMSSPPSVKSSKWKCDSCWVMNDASANKCVCCGGTNLSDACKATKAKETAKSPEIKLPSHSCFSVNIDYSNKSNASPKDAKPVTTSSLGFFGSNNNGDSILTSIAKTQKSNRWECPCCLVMNESNKSMCVCCGGENEANRKLPEVKFNFGSVANTTFKFGIDPKVQEATIAKKPDIVSTQDVKLKEQLEANNNTVAETPTYTFTLPAKKEEAKVESTKPKANDVNNVKFNFGIPKLPQATDKKSEPCKPTVENKEKAQVVPQIKNNIPVQQSPKLLGDFNATQSIKQANDKSVESTPTSIPFTQPLVDLKKDTHTNVEEKAISINKPQSQSILNPVPSSSKPSSSLFSIPGTMSSSTVSFTQSPPNVVPTTASATPALPITSLPKSETTTSITPSLIKPVVAAPLFSFGEKTVSNVSSTPTTTLSSVVATTDKPSFQFTFGSNSIKTDTPPSLLPSSNTQPLFNSPFGSREETPKTANNFGFNGGNTIGTSNAISTLGGTNALSGSNGLSNNDRPANNTLGGNNLTVNPLGSNLSVNNLSGNMLTGNTLTGNSFGTNTLTGGNSATSVTNIGGINGLPGNSLAGGNSISQASSLNNNPLTNNSTNIFGSAVQKENNTMWNSSNGTPTTNLFVPNTTANNLQKPPAFSFGTSKPFNSSNPAPAFGNNTQPAQNIFGIPTPNNNNQPSLFTNPVQSQIPAPMFGAPQPSSNPTPQMGLFGTPAVGTTPAFAPNPSISTFDAPSMPSTAAPAFNFGSPVQSTGIFGFGQQQQQPQSQQTGVYSFGGAPQAAPQVQFAMGTAPNPAGRRLRKAVRRTTPR